MITASVFNISSDAMMLAITLPLLIRAQLPLGRKLALVAVFSLGLFVILAAVLNRYYTFSQPFSPIFLNWYVGEAAAMVYVSNILLCWPLIRRVFNVGAFAKSSGGGNGTNMSGTGRTSGRPGLVYGNGTTASKNVKQSGRVRLPSDGGSHEVNENDFNSSEERIVGQGAWYNGSDEESGKNYMELRPVVKGAGFKNEITSGEATEEHREEDKTNATITKTVQVTQHHSS
jgi:hypothetical protein